MNNNQTKELTFGDIFNMIISHKKILIIVTLVITILGTAFFSIFMNTNTEYASIFGVEYPNHQTQTLPDGTKFKYNEIISKKSLYAVKENNEKLADVDVDGMIEQNGISIAFETKTINGQAETQYKINVKTSYFKDKNQAKLFITELTNLPINNIKTMVQSKKHDVSLEAFNISNDYELKLNFLNSQKTYLLNAYSQGASTFGEILIDGATMNNFKQEISNYFTINSIDSLINELSVHGYAEKDENLAKEYKMRVTQLTEEKAVNVAAIKSLKDELNDFQADNPNLSSETLFDEIYKHIASLVTRNAKIDQEIATLNNKIGYAEGNIPAAEAQVFENFKTKVNAYYLKLVEFTEEYQVNVNSAYEKTSRISFSTPAILTTENGFSILYSAILSLICGLIFASITCIIYDSTQKRKQLAKAEVKTEVESKTEQKEIKE